VGKGSIFSSGSIAKKTMMMTSIFCKMTSMTLSSDSTDPTSTKKPLKIKKRNKPVINADADKNAAAKLDLPKKQRKPRKRKNEDVISVSKTIEEDSKPDNKGQLQSIGSESSISELAEEDNEDFGLHEELKAEKTEALEQNALVSDIVNHFSVEQTNRYEFYRRSSFQKAAVRKLISQVTGTPISVEIVIAMAGISKIFVGEIIETARTVMDEWRESGPIRPRHIREAYRKLKENNKIPYCRETRHLFSND